MDAFLVPQPTDSDADAASHATELTDSDATEHAAEVQGRGSLHHHQQVMLQSAPPPTYEVELLQYWARSRPVARIFMATGSNLLHSPVARIFIVLELVIPFLTMEPPALTMCGPKEGNVYVWCDRCANLCLTYPCCAATHNACPHCRSLRTIMQLSRRWCEFMWDYRMDMETAES